MTVHNKDYLHMDLSCALKSNTTIFLYYDMVKIGFEEIHCNYNMSTSDEISLTVITVSQFVSKTLSPMAKN